MFGRRSSEAAPIPLAPVPASEGTRAALGQPGVATVVVRGVPTRPSSLPPATPRPCLPDDGQDGDGILTHAELLGFLLSLCVGTLLTILPRRVRARMLGRAP